MPIHNWSSTPAGLFHHFHQSWAVAICDALNLGKLPRGYYALLEQHAAGVIPDVVTLERGPNSRRTPTRRVESPSPKLRPRPGS